MPFWHRVVIAAVVIAAALVAAKLADLALGRRTLPPEAVTRYRVVRRLAISTIVFVGVLSALLVIPQVRAVAGGLLASSAVLGVIVGFASQRTLGNFVAGIMIAIAQPIRLGDRVTYAGEQGVVEEIGLSFTLIRAPDGDRLVVPNEKLASDTIRNSTIRSQERFAEITVQVPLSADLGAVVEAVREELAGDRETSVFVSALDGDATLTIRAPAGDEDVARRLEGELRLRAHERLRTLGVWK